GGRRGPPPARGAGPPPRRRGGGGARGRAADLPLPPRLDVRRRWSTDELREIAEADGLPISSFRKDGVTYGTPTWIWSVAVDGALYARAYNGERSRWYQAAVRQRLADHCRRRDEGRSP